MNPFLYLVTNCLKSLLNRTLCIYNNCSIFSSKVINDFFCFIIICLKSLFNDFYIIIYSSTCFSSMKQPLKHAGLSALKYNNKRNKDIWMSVHVPSSQVLFISWEAIDKKLTSKISFSSHFSLKQFYCYFTWNYLTFNHICIQQLCIWRILSFSLLS